MTQEESKFPTEWSLGYIFAQDKNTDYKHNDESTAWIGVGKRFRWKYLILGLGLVAVNQTSQRMSSHLNFKPEAGFQLGPVVLLFQHISIPVCMAIMTGRIFSPSVIASPWIINCKMTSFSKYKSTGGYS